MKISPTIRNPKSEIRNGFTLIELLVVIAIIALLAGLIVGGFSLANAKSHQSRVITEREALITAIERYHKAKGFYPPDGGLDPACVTTPLFYELTGMSANANGTLFTNSVTGEIVDTNQLGMFFNTTSIINSSSDPSSPAQNFFGGGLRTSQYLLSSYTNNGVSMLIAILGVPVSGPTNVFAATASASAISSINPWHYNYSHPANNQGSYDLWMDVQYGGHTNRISNWSKDPQPL